MMGGQEIVLIGYGSLMSGMGLLRSGRLRVKKAQRVSLDNCQRGFAKYAQRGDRYALDIEFLDRTKPIFGTITKRGALYHGVEGLALWARGIDLEGVMEREGYSTAAFHKLLRLSKESKLPLGQWLWTIYEEAGFDLVSYRRCLYAQIGYTSPHYIPHPVAMADRVYGILFLAPAYNATGANHVISVRQRTSVPRAMSLVDAWARKPNEGQLDYFVSCLLGGVHGINIRDLLAGLKREASLRSLLQEQVAIHTAEEITAFLRAIHLSPEVYTETFGTLEENWARGGLSELLKSNPPIAFEKCERDAALPNQNHRAFSN
jgi:hypothetical protein